MIFLYIILGASFWCIIGYLLENMINEVFKPRFNSMIEEEEYLKKQKEKSLYFKIKKFIKKYEKKIIF